MRGPNSHAAASDRRNESSAGENDCAARMEKRNGGVRQLVVLSGSYLHARLASSGHSHPFATDRDFLFFLFF